MALRIVDGFDYFPSSGISTVASAMGWYDGARVSRSSTTAFGYGYALAWATTGNTNTRRRQMRDRYIAGSGNYYVMGFRFRVPSNSSGNQTGVADSFTSGQQVQWYLDFTSDGSIYFYNGNGSLQAKTKSGVFVADKWFYLEIKWEVGTSNLFELRINTVPVLSLSTANTVYGTLIGGMTDRGFDLFYQYVNNISSNSGSTLMDDFYFLDDTGSVNNDYLGNVRVKYQQIVGEDSVQWTIGGTSPAATNWQSVLNTALDDTKYVYSSTVGYQDWYNPDPNLNTPFVYGFELTGSYKMDDATQRVVRTNYKTTLGTVGNGEDKYINQDYTFYPDIHEINPDTSVQFTGAEVNALLIGPEVVT